MISVLFFISMALRRKKLGFLTWNLWQKHTKKGYNCTMYFVKLLRTGKKLYANWNTSDCFSITLLLYSFWITNQALASDLSTHQQIPGRWLVLHGVCQWKWFQVMAHIFAFNCVNLKLNYCRNPWAESFLQWCWLLQHSSHFCCFLSSSICHIPVMNSNRRFSGVCL